MLPAVILADEPAETTSADCESVNALADVTAGQERVGDFAPFVPPTSAVTAVPDVSPYALEEMVSVKLPLPSVVPSEAMTGPEPLCV